MESPNAVSEYENVFETVVCMNKSKNSPSPNRFDSAKKQRKIGLVFYFFKILGKNNIFSHCK